MREPEYVKNHDGVYFDESLITDIPKKITIIDDKVFVPVVKIVFGNLDRRYIFGIDDAWLNEFSREFVKNVLNLIVNSNRAWMHGPKTAFPTIAECIKVGIAELSPVNREIATLHFDEETNDIYTNLLVQVCRDMIGLMKEHMNPDPFTLHRVSETNVSKTFLLEEMGNWCMLEWTKMQSDLLRKANADL